MTTGVVSVIVPAYQAERFLGQALDSALAQEGVPVEVIVVDDGSTDRTAEIATRPGVRLVQQHNRGIAAARNAGLALATGEFVAILDADDLWPTDRLLHQVGYLRTHPECGIVMGLTEIFLNPGDKRPKHWPHVLEGQTIPHHASSVLARRKVFEMVGGFDESLRLCEDIDWLARAKDAGVRAGSIDRLALRYRIHATNTTSDTRGIQTNLLRVLRASIQRQRAGA